MRPLILILAVALTAVVTLTVLRAPKKTEPPLQKMWAIPEFTLTERSGQPLSLSDLKGKVWVADFFYTTCPTECPMLTSHLSKLHQALASNPQVRLVSISSDPEKDTPEVLRAYAKSFGASERWYFLTGTEPQIDKLANEGFKIARARVADADEPIVHGPQLLLIDQTGTVRGVYDGLSGDHQKLLADIQRLEKEPQ